MPIPPQLLISESLAHQRELVYHNITSNASIFLLNFISYFYDKKQRAENFMSSALMQLTGLEPVPSQPGLDP